MVRDCQTGGLPPTCLGLVVSTYLSRPRLRFFTRTLSDGCARGRCCVWATGFSRAFESRALLRPPWVH